MLFRVFVGSEYCNGKDWFVVLMIQLFVLD
jgi:hypothetical protein